MNDIKNIRNLKDSLKKVWSEACSGIMRLMDYHGLKELDLKKYEYMYDLDLPHVMYYTDDENLLGGYDEEGFIVTKPVSLTLRPGGLGLCVDLDGRNGGGYTGFTGETGLNAVEMVELYDFVSEVFAIIDNGIEPYHECPEDDDDE